MNVPAASIEALARRRRCVAEGREIRILTEISTGGQHARRTSACDVGTGGQERSSRLRHRIDWTSADFRRRTGRRESRHRDQTLGRSGTAASGFVRRLLRSQYIDAELASSGLALTR